MRFIVLGVFVFFFAVLPFYVLNTLVMPQITQLKQSYANEDQTVQAIVSQR